MHKRKFLQFFAIGSAGTALSGCATQGPLKEVFAPPAPRTSTLHKAPLSAQELASAAQARALINGPDGQGVSEAALRQAFSEWKDLLKPFAATKKIPLEQSTPVALATG